MAELQNYLDEVAKERAYQIDKWGDQADDEKNDPMSFVGYIANHSTRWFSGGFKPYSLETLVNFRTCMLKVAALGIAAMQWADRLLEGKNVRPDVLKD